MKHKSNGDCSPEFINCEAYSCRKKVYCKDCKFFRKGQYYVLQEMSILSTCTKITGVRELDAYDTPLRRVEAEVLIEKVGEKWREINKDNNCKYYIKRWWKFWKV